MPRGPMSRRTSQVLEVLDLMRRAKPTNPAEMGGVRRVAFRQAADKFGVRPETIHDACCRRLSITAIADFDELVGRWLLGDSSDLERRLVAHTPDWDADKDLGKIERFFGRSGRRHR
jgi:hypothetical protein